MARVLLDNQPILEGWRPDHRSFKEYRTVFTATSVSGVVFDAL